MFVVDDLDGVDACYHFAGIVGIRPERLTLKRLWQMAAGRMQQQRETVLQQAQWVWGLGDIDPEKYLAFGTMEETKVGGPVELSPEMQSRVDEEIERIRRENPDLPKLRGVKK